MEKCFDIVDDSLNVKNEKLLKLRNEKSLELRMLLDQ